MKRWFAAVPGVVLVAVAAAMWGTDPIIRKTMSGTTSATTIVFGEHVILVALTLPLLFLRCAPSLPPAGASSRPPSSSAREPRPSPRSSSPTR
jgi:hypothetical protein